MLGNNMKTSNRLIKNFVSLSGAEIISRIVGAGLSIYIARLLGATAYGQLAFATAFISFFNIFADFGLTTLGIREIAKDKDKTNSYGSGIFFFQTLLAIALYIILTVIVILMPVSSLLKAIMLIFGLGMIPTALDMSYIFQAHERMEFIPIGRIISQCSYVILGFILITLTRNIIAVPIASTFSLFVVAVVAYIILHKHFAFYFERFSISQMKLLVIAAMPFVLSSLMGTIYHNLDSVLIQFMKGSTQVGYYNAGYKIVNLILVFVVFIASVFFPLLAHSFKTDRAQFIKHGIFFAQAMGIVTIPISIGGFVYAQKIIPFIFGNGYNPGISPFQVIIFLVILIGLNLVLSDIIITANLQKHNTISVACGALINLILNFLLIPTYGIIGAAWSTIAAEAVVCAYLLIIHIIRIHSTLQLLITYFCRPLFASIVMIGLLSIVHLSSILVIGVLATIIYLGIMIAIQGIPLEFITTYLKRN